MGNHYAIRTQRAVFQQWKENVPWAQAGQVTIANGGDIAKELGWLPEEALQPEAGPFQRWQVTSLLVGPGSPGRLYALQGAFVGPYTAFEQYRLMISDDLGHSWSLFPGTLPASIIDIDMDYQKQDALYLSTNNGLYAWSGQEWTHLSSQRTLSVAVAFGEPNTIWGVHDKDVLRSDDGGHTWHTVTSFNTPRGIFEIEIDPRDNQMLYAMISDRGPSAILVRGDTEGAWESMPTPGEELTVSTGMTINGRTGDLYVTSWTTDPALLWRSSNPRTTNVEDVRWQKVAEIDQGARVVLLASGHTSDGLVLFANFHPSTYGEVPAELHHSFDHGQSWQKLTIP